MDSNTPAPLPFPCAHLWSPTKLPEYVPGPTCPLADDFHDGWRKIANSVCALLRVMNMTFPASICMLLQDLTSESSSHRQWKQDRDWLEDTELKGAWGVIQLKSNVFRHKPSLRKCLIQALFSRSRSYAAAWHNPARKLHLPDSLSISVTLFLSISRSSWF